MKKQFKLRVGDIVELKVDDLMNRFFGDDTEKVIIERIYKTNDCRRFVSYYGAPGYEMLGGTIVEELGKFNKRIIIK